MKEELECGVHAPRIQYVLISMAPLVGQVRNPCNANVNTHIYDAHPFLQFLHLENKMLMGIKFISKDLNQIFYCYSITVIRFLYVST